MGGVGGERARGEAGALASRAVRHLEGAGIPPGPLAALAQYIVARES